MGLISRILPFLAVAATTVRSEQGELLPVYRVLRLRSLSVRINLSKGDRERVPVRFYVENAGTFSLCEDELSVWKDNSYSRNITIPACMSVEMCLGYL